MQLQFQTLFKTFSYNQVSLPKFSFRNSAISSRKYIQGVYSHWFVIIVIINTYLVLNIKQSSWHIKITLKCDLYRQILFSHFSQCKLRLRKINYNLPQVIELLWHSQCLGLEPSVSCNKSVHLVQQYHSACLCSGQLLYTSPTRGYKNYMWLDYLIGERN